MFVKMTSDERLLGQIITASDLHIVLQKGFYGTNCFPNSSAGDGGEKQALLATQTAASSTR
jgi:hypothetical protein